MEVSNEIRRFRSRNPRRQMTSQERSCERLDRGRLRGLDRRDRYEHKYCCTNCKYGFPQHRIHCNEFDLQRKLATIEKSVEALQIQVEQRKCGLDTNRATLREAEAREENLRSEVGYWKGIGIEMLTTTLQ